MPKNRTPAAAAFGARLASLRKAAGYTQLELAAELGISQRMVAYYEGPDAHPPANLLPTIAQTLNVTLDQLLGVAPVKKTAAAVGSSRLARRLQELEKLDPKDKRQVLQLLDAFLERERLKRKMQTRPSA
jgi:transcriptional regulator with XRE-family HTH domain